MNTRRCSRQFTHVPFPGSPLSARSEKRKMTHVDSLTMDVDSIHALPTADLYRRLADLPVKARLEAVLAGEDAGEVVAALPVQDFYHFVVEIGPEDSLPLLARARVEQLNYLFDLQWWKKDEVDSARALEWLTLLARAGEKKLLAWLVAADFELLVSLFKKWITVVPAPEEEDLLEARDRLPVRTLDDQFFWECLYPQYEDLVNGILSLLFEAHRGFYQELMNSVLWASSVELEEDAYRFHRGRLEDHGVPDFYEAMEIYRAVEPAQFALDKSAATPHQEHGESSPSFALVALTEKDLLTQSLRTVENRLLADTLQMELASLANRVLIADRLSLDSPESLRFAVQKAGAYLNLGLQLLGARSPEVAVGLLEKHYLEHLFRHAHGKIAGVCGRLRNILRKGWLSRWPEGIHLLDMPWLETAELLAGKTPRIIRRDLDNPSVSREDFFRTPEDLRAAKHAVDVIRSVGPLFEALGLENTSLGHPETLWARGQIRSRADITLAAVVLSAAGNVLWRGQWNPRPLPVSMWPSLKPLLTPHGLDELIRDWIRKILADSSQQELAEAYFTPILAAYAAEMEPFGDGKIPDPEMVRFFLFTDQQ